MHKPAFLALLMVAIAPFAPSASAAASNQPVAQLDLDRYTGTWHEIAHLPMFFQRKCVDNITATYTKRPDGTISVANACRKSDGTKMESVGSAKTVEGKPGQLKVRFAPQWLSWLPMVWGDYWVIDLDPEYRWAVVGGPSRENLWILSRSPSMPKAQFEGIKASAKAKGYPVDKLIVAAPLD